MQRSSDDQPPKSSAYTKQGEPRGGGYEGQNCRQPELLIGHRTDERVGEGADQG